MPQTIRHMPAKLFLNSFCSEKVGTIYNDQAKRLTTVFLFSYNLTNMLAGCQKSGNVTKGSSKLQTPVEFASISIC